MVDTLSRTLSDSCEPRQNASSFQERHGAEMPIPLGWAWRGLTAPLPDNLALYLVGSAGPANHDALCLPPSRWPLLAGTHTARIGGPVARGNLHWAAAGSAHLPALKPKTPPPPSGMDSPACANRIDRQAPPCPVIDHQRSLRL